MSKVTPVYGTRCVFLTRNKQQQPNLITQNECYAHCSKWGWDFFDIPCMYFFPFPVLLHAFNTVIFIMSPTIHFVCFFHVNIILTFCVHCVFHSVIQSVLQRIKQLHWFFSSFLCFSKLTNQSKALFFVYCFILRDIIMGPGNKEQTATT